MFSHYISLLEDDYREYRRRFHWKTNEVDESC